MNMDTLDKKNRLGTGLDSLLGSSLAKSQISSLGLEQIIRDPKQPRKTFDEDSLKALAQSIKEHGVLQPILVQKENDSYKIIAGERRWRACQLAGLHKIPVLIKDPSPEQASLWALLENIQRQDLNPIEIAQSFQSIAKDQNLSQEELADLVCLPRSSIANFLRLLNLDSKVQSYIIAGKISFSQAREILKAKTNQDQRRLAEKCIKGSLTVRALNSEINKSPKKNPAPSWLKASLKELSKKISTPPQVQFSSEGKGRVVLKFKSEAELKMILDRLWQK